MTETHTTEARLSRTRKAAIATALVAGLSGAFTIVGISAASSDPGSGTPSTEVEGDSPMDLGDPADCEFSEEGHAMFENGMFENGHMGNGSDMGDMGEMLDESFSDMWSDGPASMMGGGTRMGA